MDPKNEPPEGQVPSWSELTPPWAGSQGSETPAAAPESPQAPTGESGARIPPGAEGPGETPAPTRPDPAMTWAAPQAAWSSPENAWPGAPAGQGAAGMPPAGYPPAGYPPYPTGPMGTGGPPSQAPRPKRSRRVVAALVAAAVVIAAAGAGAGAAIAAHNNDNRDSSAANSGAGLAATPPTKGTLSTSQVAALVDPAVVDINTVVQLPSGPGQAAGTGMIATSNGEIITNNHVVASATSIKVTIAKRGTYVARVVGTDPTADVAVLQLTGVGGLPTVKFGDSSAVSVGDSVVAIGNALGLGGSPTVTTGIVSALGRSITASDEQGSAEHLTGMIQTDAPIAPGNSGGPLVDRTGEVIGMNTAAASANGQGASLGFALPINRVLQVANDIEQGHATGGIILGVPAFLGIDGQTTGLSGSGPSSGVGIVYVQPSSPAARAGLAAGDVIVAFDGHATPTIGGLAGLIHQHHPGDHATVTFEGPNGTRTVTVQLAAGPAA